MRNVAAAQPIGFQFVPPTRTPRSARARASVYTQAAASSAASSPMTIAVPPRSVGPSHPRGSVPNLGVVCEGAGNSQVEDQHVGGGPGAADRHEALALLVVQDEVVMLGGAVEIARLARGRSEEHTSELQSPCNLVC